MNDRQAKLLLLAAAVLIAMVLYTPFVQFRGNGYTRNVGYAWLVFLRPPQAGAIVNIPLLATQEPVAAAAFAAMYFYLGRKRSV
jgi:hypothetical protein